MRRQRITITIKEDILDQVDRIIDGLTIRSRSQAIEYLLSKFLVDFRLKNVLLLAGGNKKIEKKPVFTFPINNKPLLWHIMKRISDYGISHFNVYTDSKHNEIQNCLLKTEFNVNFLKNDKPIGTIEPLQKAKELFDDTFLVGYGDSISSINLNEMLSFHKKNNALVTIALTTVSNPKDYGMAILEGNKIKEFKEKPSSNISSYLVSSGYFLFEPRIYKYISRNMKSIEKDLFPKLAEKGLLYGYSFQGIYVNVNNINDLKRAKRIL